MRTIFIIGWALLLTGCAGLIGAPAKNLTSLKDVRTGMSKDQVAAVAGSEIIIGYEITNQVSGAYKPITLKNPYRVDTVQRGLRKYEVLFYVTHIKQADGAITDDELTPLVFEQEKLVGEGWIYLNGIRKKN